MFTRSLILLASAGAAVAQLAPECEQVTDLTALLENDDGKAYCSSVLSIGTATETIVESTTTTETSTVTTPSQVTLSITTMQTDTVSEGTVTETAPTATKTSTNFETTTVYSCPTVFKRDNYGTAQSTSCTKGKTTSTPTPSSTSCAKSKTSATPTPVKTSTSCTSSQQHASSVAAYSAGQPPVYSQGATSSAQNGYYAPGSQSAYPLQPAASSAQDGYYAPESSHAAYESGYAPKPYPSIATGYYQNASSAGYASSSIYYEAYPTTSSIYEQISSLISSFAGYPTASSSAEVSSSFSSYYSSEIVTSSETSSEIYTPSPTPTPTPTPSCETAPTALQTGYECDAISTACGCLGLTSATAQVTTTTTLTEAVYVTEETLFTTTTTLTETVFTTVPAATETFTPSVTVVAFATQTASVCPCTASQTLCGTTPDTCKDLQNDPNNCGTCGTVCNSGQCSAGKCLDCIPRNCGTFSQGRCNNAGVCYCVTSSAGKAMCADLSLGDCNRYATCSTDSNCGAGEICTAATCCRTPICVKANTCGNPQNVKRMFTPRGKGAMARNDVIGDF